MLGEAEILTLGEEELHKIWLSETSRHDNEENDPEDRSVSKESSGEVQCLKIEVQSFNSNIQLLEKTVVVLKEQSIYIYFIKLNKK